MKRLLLTFLSLLSIALSYAYDFVVDGIYYDLKVNGKSVCVTYGDNKYIGNIIIPDKVTYNAISYSVTEIGSCAFKDCRELSHITIPNSVTHISERAFSGCITLSDLFVPKSVTNIDSYAFEKCDNLISLYIEDGETELSLSLYSSYYPFVGCKVETLYVGRNLSSWQALCNSNKLRTVNIGNYVTTIGSYAFENCVGLTEVDIPESVITIGSKAFHNCYKLSSVTIPNSVTTIRFGAFESCYDLNEVVIPNSVTTIDGSAFSHCTGLKQLRIEDGQKELSLYYEWLGYDFYPFRGCNVETLYVGRNLSCWKSLCNSGDLKTAEIGNYVTSIGNKSIGGSDAFAGCYGLTSLKIGNAVTEIGAYSFSGCSGLTSVTIPNSVTSIDSHAFGECYGLKEVEIPNSVTEIDAKAFQNCTNLKSLSFVDGFDPISVENSAFEESPLTDVIIGRNIEGEPFREIETLETAWITDAVTTIPDHLFYHCSGLKNLYVGDGVTKISDWAFSGCYGLKLFNFGKNIKEIGQDALSDCSGLTNIYAEPLTPPSVYAQGLDDINKWECTLHYLVGAPYNAANQWKEFLLTDNDFVVTMPESEVTAEAGEVITVTAQVDEDINPAEVVWRSSNPGIAEIVKDTENEATSVTTRAATRTISAKVKVYEKAQVTIAAFLPSGQMANCILNKGISGIDDVAIDGTSVVVGPNDIYTLQGICLKHNATKEDIDALSPGLYIIGGKKVLKR